MSKKILIGALLDFVDDPAMAGLSAVRYVEQGGLLIDNGIIVQRGTADEMRTLAQADASIDVQEYANKLIIPGMIDTHIHYPQTEMIAAYGEQLLTWLTEHAFPTEKKFADKKHGTKVANVFLNELLKNGTTTALVFGTVHPQSVDAFFEVAQQKGLRMICGKVMMDRNCPDDLQDTADSSYTESKALIEKWHGVDRLSYAVTPRFAPTSKPQQLAACKQLLDEYHDVYMHTHVSENVDECAWVAELFPQSTDYVCVYEDAGLLRKRSVLAHGIHFSERELCCVAEHDTASAHCPTSNLFIGSGLFNIKQMREHNIAVGMGTDVGGGSSFSLLKTYNEAYKVQQLQNNKSMTFAPTIHLTPTGNPAYDQQVSDQVIERLKTEFAQGMMGNMDVATRADGSLTDKQKG